MNRTFLRTIAALLVGGYSLAVTVSGLFHTHGRHACHLWTADHDALGPESSCCGHHHHGLGHHPVSGLSSDTTRLDGQREGPGPIATQPQGGDCPVCKFLARKPVSPAPVREVVSTDLAEPVVRIKAIARVEEPISTVWSRGPPPVL